MTLRGAWDKAKSCQKGTIAKPHPNGMAKPCPEEGQGCLGYTWVDLSLITILVLLLYDYELTKDTSYLTFTGKLWSQSVSWEYFVEKWPCSKEFWLYCRAFQERATPRDRQPPRPPVKSAPPVSRIFPAKDVGRALAVSFKGADSCILSSQSTNDLLIFYTCMLLSFRDKYYQWLNTKD